MWPASVPLENVSCSVLYKKQRSAHPYESQFDSQQLGKHQLPTFYHHLQLYTEFFFNHGVRA